MKIEKHAVATIHYTLTDNEGAIIDSSVDDEPLSYLSGTGNIIPGLEEALLGCEPGDKKKVTVEPAQGYGEHDAKLVQKVPAEMFSGIDKVEEGMEFETQSPEGESQFVIVMKVEDDGVTIDGNHELAGVTLNFDVSVESVREATPTEIEHGHVH